MAKERILPYTTAQLAYAAGFFDGEGCVSFTLEKCNKSGSIAATIGNTNKEVLDFIHKIFGGRLSFYKSNNAKHKDVHSWVISGSDCIDFLTAIKPWVIIKHEQICLAEFFFEIRNVTNRPAPADLAYSMILIRDQFRWLNRRGPRREDDIEPIPYRTGSIWYEDYPEIIKQIQQET
jgi:hypothetical protein